MGDWLGDCDGLLDGEADGDFVGEAEGDVVGVEASCRRFETTTSLSRFHVGSSIDSSHTWMAGSNTGFPSNRRESSAMSCAPIRNVAKASPLSSLAGASRSLYWTSPSAESTFIRSSSLAVLNCGDRPFSSRSEWMDKVPVCRFKTEVNPCTH